MKRRIGKISITALLILVSVLLTVNLLRPVTAIPRDATREMIGAYTGPRAGTNLDDNIKAANDRAYDQALAGMLGTSGTIFYCDSEEATGTENGLSWLTATDTLDEAVNLCTANAGDIILVAPGHAETFIIQALDVDVIGVTIIGLGTGSDKPTLTYNHANAETAIGADNVTIKGIIFHSTITGVLMGIEVEDSVDFFTIEKCEFTVDDAAVDEFIEAINFVNNNIGCTIRNNKFNAKAAGAAHAIFMDADTNTTSIIGNDIRGAYSVACIGGDTAASTDLLIKDNILINGSLVADTGINTVAAIVLLDNTAGLIVDNRIVSDVATALLMRVADDMCFMNNFVLDTDGDEFSGTKEEDAASVAGHADG